MKIKLLFTLLSIFPSMSYSLHTIPGIPKIRVDKIYRAATAILATPVIAAGVAATYLFGSVSEARDSTALALSDKLKEVTENPRKKALESIKSNRSLSIATGVIIAAACVYKLNLMHQQKLSKVEKQMETSDRIKLFEINHQISGPAPYSRNE